MLLASVEQIRKLDETTIKSSSLTGLELMENAGKCLLNASDSMLEKVDTPKVAIFCGKGNNGGDGFVLGRLLRKKGIPVDVFLLGEKTSLKGDANTNYKKLSEWNINVKEVLTSNQIPNLENYSLVVDALLGTGFSGILNGVMADVVNHINTSAVLVLSVDTPTGVNCDTGEVSNPSVYADVTVTFGLPKIGQLFYPAKELIGEMVVGDIGFEDETIEKINIKTNISDYEMVNETLPEVAPTSHKYQCGTVLIVAGSLDYSGAAILTARAALRAGAGMVYLLTPASVRTLIDPVLPEIITVPLAETNTGHIALRAYGTIEKYAAKANAIVVGPGLGKNQYTIKLVKKLVDKIELPMLLDADGINCLEGIQNPFKKRKDETIMTPHEEELKRIKRFSHLSMGINRIEEISSISKKLDCTILLKGPSTIVTDGEFSTINTTGNAGMATAGSGDVLSGIIGTYMAKGLSVYDSGKIGAFIHGLSGDVQVEELGDYSLIASDIVDGLSKAYKEVFS